jgi:hypothetical protein
MDGRYETVYDPPFIEALQEAEQEGNLSIFLTEQGADVLLVPVNSPLFEAAWSHPDWTLHYTDDTASVFAPGPAEAQDARTGQPRPWAHFP